VDNFVRQPWPEDQERKNFKVSQKNEMTFSQKIKIKIKKVNLTNKI
jgi:hypothetical protein